jgi:hypothetical protein
MAGRPEACVARGFRPLRMSTRGTEPGTVVERALKGENPRRAPTGGLCLARRGGRRGTDSRGEQGFEVGGPAANRRAQCRWEVDGTCGTPRVRRGDRTSDREEPSSRLMRPGSTFGWARAAKSWRDTEKAAVKLLQALRRRQSDSANPQGSRWPARAGTAPREGKALEGSSRDASGMKEGREAQGATANGGVPKTSCEPRASRNRREGQEP